VEDVGDDLHRAVVVLRDGAEDPRGECVPQALLDGLAALVPGISTTWVELDRAHRELSGRQTSAGSYEAPAGEVDVDVFWSLLPDILPCRFLDRGPVPRTDVVTWSDFLSDRAFLSSRVYSELYAAWGERYLVIVPLPAPPGRERKLMIARDDHCFSPRERDLLTLLQPHLAEAHRTHQRRRAGVPELTPRQWQVLRCLAAGQGTADAARALVVTEATVRKHLENVYERLGVGTRTAAVARAFGRPELADAER
jgi:DNA-binding CsgD family transcriptional regulator